MKENKTTAVEAKHAISVKNTYDNTKRFTIALWAQRKRELTAEEELAVVDYRGKIITVLATLDKQKRRAECADKIAEENAVVDNYLSGEITLERFKELYQEFLDRIPSITHVKRVKDTAKFEEAVSKKLTSLNASKEDIATVLAIIAKYSDKGGE